MFTNFFARWRARDAEARVAEESVLLASLRALDQRGAPPSMEKRHKARQLREGANALLNAALAEVKSLASPRNLPPEAAKKVPRSGQ